MEQEDVNDMSIGCALGMMAAPFRLRSPESSCALEQVLQDVCIEPLSSPVELMPASFPLFCLLVLLVVC